MNPEQNRLRMVGVPMDLGSGRRGVDMGPSAIRIAGIGPQLRELGFEVADDGDALRGRQRDPRLLQFAKRPAYAGVSVRAPRPRK